MKFSRMTEHIDGLKYLAGKLELSGSRPLRYLMETHFCTNRQELESGYDILQSALDLVSDPARLPDCMRLNHLFSQIHDIQGTLQAVAAKRVLDEIELFEIKYFAFLCSDFSSLLNDMGFTHEPLYPLNEVTAILDPDGTGVVSFYIYNSYSQSLAAARDRLRGTDPGEQPGEWETLRQAVDKAELEVRDELSRRINNYYGVLRENFDTLARIEIWFAKAYLAKRYRLVRPEFIPDSGPEFLTIEEMFHPHIADALEDSGISFQPVSIRLEKGPCLLTGANMSGKTVVLKTVSLIQTLAQYGFFVPAGKARLTVVEELFLVSGDRQDPLRGLSSFAAEMLELNRIFAAVKKGTCMIVLIDEPARTTNPNEGMALVSALADFFTLHRTTALISTHFGDMNLSCRKLRVKGFTSQSAVPGEVNAQNINKYIDYSLVEDMDGLVPEEALRIARLLGVDASFLELAKKYVK
jgi:DNA mismatch repair protein MutS2